MHISLALGRTAPMNYPTLGRAPDPFSDLEQARQLFNQARELVAAAQNERLAAEAIRGQALWCDQGGHAFSPRDRGRQQWTVKVYDDDSGEPITETRQACSEHGPDLGQRRTNPGPMPKEAIRGLTGRSVTDPDEARDRGYDPDYVKWLEERTHEPIAD